MNDNTKVTVGNIDITSLWVNFWESDEGKEFLDNLRKDELFELLNPEE